MDLSISIKKEKKMNTQIFRYSSLFAAFLFLLAIFPLANYSIAGEMDIVETAVSAGSFDTLVAAVKAAGLVDVLKGEGPFTVFAPTDDAFKKLPAGTVESLVNPENKDKLTAILTYHVIAGKVMASDLLKLTSAKTVNGQSIAIGLTVDNAKVVMPDIKCSNGVIHVIDAVILPKEK